MAKRKPNQSPISLDLVRWGVIVFFILLAVVISGVALTSFVRHARLFVIKDVVLAQSLGEISLPDLGKLKGQNIFAVDLEKVEEKILARYPGVAGLEVLRRFPDEILIVGSRRTAFAVTLLEGRSVALSQDGCFIGSPGKEDAGLPVIKGLQRQKTAPGMMLSDPSGMVALNAVSLVNKDQSLLPLHLRSLDVSVPEKMILTFGLTEDQARFDVIVDKENFAAKLKTLAMMVARTDLAINEVKYIDLRFETPVIGKRKSKK
ncbi:MAG: FtsQ-type POTRA domain-containing protein [Candidatus Omnitrophota bacterium]